MLSKRNRRKLKTYKGGGPALNSYMNSKPVSAKITQEMVDAYGYPEKYIGYDVALSPSGIEKPFTISEMCELVWILQKHLDFSNLLSESNVKAIDTQLNKDIYRDIKVYINGQDVKTDSPSEDYAQFINQQFSGVSPETITQIKLLINQFALSVASDIMGISLPKYKDEHIMVQPLNSSTLETYKDIFPNINNNKIINVTYNSDNIIIDESYFTSLIILKPVDPFENISDDPYEDVGVAAVFVYCDFKKDKGFFIWDKKIKPQQEQQYQQEEQEQQDLDPEQARTSINNIVLGSIGAAAVATGAVVGTLFGVGVLGGKSKKKRKTRKSIRKKRRTTRQIKTRKTRKTRTKR